MHLLFFDVPSLENFQVKYFVQIKLVHLPLSPGYVTSYRLGSLLHVHKYFFSCYCLSFSLKEPQVQMAVDFCNSHVFCKNPGSDVILPESM